MLRVKGGEGYLLHTGKRSWRGYVPQRKREKGERYGCRQRYRQRWQGIWCGKDRGMACGTWYFLWKWHDLVRVLVCTKILHTHGGHDGRVTLFCPQRVISAGPMSVQTVGVQPPSLLLWKPVIDVWLQSPLPPRWQLHTCLFTTKKERKKRAPTHMHTVQKVCKLRLLTVYCKEN